MLGILFILLHPVMNSRELLSFRPPPCLVLDAAEASNNSQWFKTGDGENLSMVESIVGGKSGFLKAEFQAGFCVGS